MQLLKPMYLASDLNSPLRPAIAAAATNLLMLFCYQGGDTDWARSFYAQSVSRMNALISDPVESKSNDLMLSALVLHFYDMINSRWSNDPSHQNKHRAGALALLKHRGSSNHQSEVARLLTTSLRTAVCHWALESRIDPGSEILDFLTADSLPTNKAAELDVHTLELVKFQTDFMQFSRTRRSGVALTDPDTARSLIQRALKVDDLLISWQKSCPTHWTPLYATADEVPQSLREAAMFGDRCSVYWDLPICDILNMYRMRRIILNRMIRQLCLDNFEPDLSDILASTETTIHQMGNDLLEAIAFITGDVADGIQHARLYEVNYPSASNGVCTFPNADHDHPRAAISSGGWLASTICGLLTKLVYKDEFFDPFPVTDSQYKFVVAQLRRLQQVFLLNQPMSWLRRSRWYQF